MTDATIMSRLKNLMAHPSAEGDALATIVEQAETIVTQRDHIRALDARIAKLEREAAGLRELL